MQFDCQRIIFRMFVVTVAHNKVQGVSRNKFTCVGKKKRKKSVVKKAKGRETFLDMFPDGRRDAIASCFLKSGCVF